MDGFSSIQIHGVFGSSNPLNPVNVLDNFTAGYIIKVVGEVSSYDGETQFQPINNQIGSIAGGDAIEIISPQQTPVQKRELWALCELHGLTASVGSDFHQVTTWNDIGKNLYLTDDVIPVWANWPQVAQAQSA